MRKAVAVVAVLAACAVSAGAASARTTPVPRFTGPILLANTDGVTEPRMAVDRRTDIRYAVANLKSGPAAVFASTDGGRTFGKTQGTIPGQQATTIDLDIVTLSTGRVIANELDEAGLTFPTGYSDDHGKTWQASSGPIVDVDRQWLAVGPHDEVYLVFHNFVSGLTAHEVMVQSSTDGGKTFGAPVPVTLPGEQAFADLSCGDSTGPSGMAVDQRSGRIYVSFTTRTSAVGGGCGKSATGEPGFNVVPSSHIWVASSPNGQAGTWKTSLAVDAAESGLIVGLQYSPVRVDTAGGVYVVYTQGLTKGSYVSDLHYAYLAPGASAWRQHKVTGTSGGILFGHIEVGKPGRIGLAYLYSRVVDGATLWFPAFSQTLDGLATRPHFTQVKLAGFPSHKGSAAQMSGSCATGPGAGIQQGLTCGRQLDNFGTALDRAGRVSVIWPAPSAALGEGQVGTYIATQLSGPGLL
ncbi:MAG: repeat-like domain [Frankiaceae bacterium]|nr:repeat-like domain [Frankiaceae bacterium]